MSIKYYYDNDENPSLKVETIQSNTQSRKKWYGLKKCLNILTKAKSNLQNSESLEYYGKTLFFGQMFGIS